MGSDWDGHHALGLRYHQLCDQYVAFNIKIGKIKGRQFPKKLRPFFAVCPDITQGQRSRWSPPSVGDDAGPL